MSKRHCRVKIGGRRVQIVVGSPTGRVEAVPVKIIIIVLHVINALYFNEFV